MIQNQTGYPGPLRWVATLRPGVDHPLNDAPQSLVDSVGDVSKAMGYSNDYILWEGPLAAGQVSGWTVTVIEAGAGASTLKLGVGAGGVGGKLQLTTDNAAGDNVNAQQDGTWYGLITGQSLRSHMLLKVNLSDLDVVAQVGLSQAATTDFVTTPSTDGLLFTHATTADQWQFQARKASTSTVVDIPVTIAAVQDIILGMAITETGGILVYAGLSAETLEQVGSIAAGDANIPTDVPLSLHKGAETATANARIMELDYVIVGQERSVV